MKWRGIRRNSLDVSTKTDEGLVAINSRFTVQGEMRRRRGMARASIIKKDYPVNNITGFSAFQSGVMAALTDGDRLQGYQQPYSLWGDNPDYTQLPLGPPTLGYRLNGDLSEVNGGTPAALAIGNATYETGWPGGGSGLTFLSSSLIAIDLGTVSSGVGTLAVTFRVEALGEMFAQFGGTRIRYTSGFIEFSQASGDPAISYPVVPGYHLCVLASNGSSATHFINGTPVGGGTSGLFGLGTINMFSSAGGGAIGDVLCWSACLDSEQVPLLAQRIPDPW